MLGLRKLSTMGKGTLEIMVITKKISSTMTTIRMIIILSTPTIIHQLLTTIKTSKEDKTHTGAQIDKNAIGLRLIKTLIKDMAKKTTKMLEISIDFNQIKRNKFIEMLYLKIRSSSQGIKI